MKSLFLFIPLVLLNGCNNDKPHQKELLKSEKQLINNAAQLESIDGIKKEYSRVNALLEAKNLDSSVYKYECNEINGEVVYYSRNNQLVLLKHTEADSHYSSVDQYFVHDNRPYFIFRNEVLWSFNGGTADHPATIDNVTEKRFYIIRNQAVQCLEKKYDIRSDAANNPNPESVPNRVLKNCSVEELQKTFAQILKKQSGKKVGTCLD